jgi:FtsH-binding integral membrane protein
MMLNSLGTCQQLAITFGIVISFIVNLVFASTSSGWRYSLAAQSIFSIILLFGTFLLPEVLY